MARDRNSPRGLGNAGQHWVMLPLDEDWDSCVRFEPQDGHPVVAEVRVLPRADTPGVLSHHDPHADRWVQATMGQTPDVPTPVGGLTARTLRRLKLGQALEAAYAQLENMIDRKGERGLANPERVTEAFTKAAVSRPRLPGRTGRDDTYYVAVAAAYVSAIGHGSRQPVVDAAKELSITWGGDYEPTYVRDLLHVARQRELLTRPPKGRAGGQLTDKARAILQREEGQ